MTVSDTLGSKKDTKAKPRRHRGWEFTSVKCPLIVIKIRFVALMMRSNYISAYTLSYETFTRSLVADSSHDFNLPFLISCEVGDDFKYSYFES